MPSGKYYAGSRWRKEANPQELLKEDGYCTSSGTVRKLIEKDGLASFKIALLIPQSNLSIHVHEYETAFLQTNNCAQSQEWLNRNNNDRKWLVPGPKTEEHKANMKGRCGTWQRQEKDINHLSQLMTKTNLEKNAMNNPESRAKVAASKVGRKRIYRDDGSFYYSPRIK